MRGLLNKNFFHLFFDFAAIVSISLFILFSVGFYQVEIKEKILGEGIADQITQVSGGDAGR